MKLAKQLHDWYLEASALLSPDSVNPQAQVTFDKLTNEQKFLDEYIAGKCKELFLELVGEPVDMAAKYEGQSTQVDPEKPQDLEFMLRAAEDIGRANTVIEIIQKVEAL